MKALSSLFERLDVAGLCTIAALAAACSFDTSQLRALADGAVHPAVPDVRTAGNDGNSANPPDAPIATGSSDGSSASTFDAPAVTGGSGGSYVTPSGGTTPTGGTIRTGGTVTPTGGTIYNPTGGTIRTGGTVTPTGGTIYNPTGGTIRTGGTVAPTGGTIYNPTGGTVTPTGGTVAPTGGTIYNPTGGTVTPTGGTIRTGGTVTPTGGTVTPTGGTVTATGGTIPASTGGATPTCTPVPKSSGGIACPGGLCTVGTYSGYDFSFDDKTGWSSVCVLAGSLCGAGTVGAQDPPDYTVWGAGFGFNLSLQATGTPIVPVQLSGTGVTVSLTSLPTGADMRVQVPVGSVVYCAVMSAATQTILWTAFNTKCWAPSTGIALTGAPNTSSIQFQACSRATAGSFDFCVTALSFQ